MSTVVWGYVLTIYVAVPQQITVMNIVQHYWKNWYSQMQLTLRRLMSYMYGAPILDVSRSHTTTQHSR